MLIISQHTKYFFTIKKMYTCIPTSKHRDLWTECKMVLIRLNYFILHEDLKLKKISARSRCSDSPYILLLEISATESNEMFFIRVDAVQNNTSDGMLSSHPKSELVFIQHLINSFEAVPFENGFRIRPDDYQQAY